MQDGQTAQTLGLARCPSQIGLFTCCSLARSLCEGSVHGCIMGVGVQAPQALRQRKRANDLRWVLLLLMNSEYNRGEGPTPDLHKRQMMHVVIRVCLIILGFPRCISNIQLRAQFPAVTLADLHRQHCIVLCLDMRWRARRRYHARKRAAITKATLNGGNLATFCSFTHHIFSWWGDVSV